ncbi:hypothetical protein MKX01_041360, partial [Papaver californicum]
TTEEMQSASSRDTASQQNMSSSSSGTPKIRIELDLALKPVGPSAAKLSIRAGDIIRSHVLINFTDWRNVPDNFKDDVWGALLVFLLFLELFTLVFLLHTIDVIVLNVYQHKLYLTGNLNFLLTQIIGALL